MFGNCDNFCEGSWFVVKSSCGHFPGGQFVQNVDRNGMPAILYFSGGRVHLSSTAARLSTLYYPAQLMASSEKRRGFILGCVIYRFFYWSSFLLCHVI